MKRSWAFFLWYCLCCGSLSAASYPFPQNQTQPNTAYYPAYSNADVTAVYNAWKSAQVTSSGAGGYRRVQRNGDPTLQANSTVSEGIGYGMIIAVYMNDQSLFDDLWRYYNLHLDGNGLMNWYISADGATVLGSGGASDADQDVAWALCMAIYQWGTPTFGGTYSALAQGLITKLYNVYVDPTTKAFWPWGGAGNTFNISYFDPAEYRVFAQVSGNTGWLSAVDGCYTALDNSLNSANGNLSNGLVPAWSTYAGVPTPGFSGAPIHFQYDSCRTPFRIAKDWYFFGEPRAKQYIDKINSFYGPIGATHITDGYDLNGSPRPQYDASGTGANGQSAAFVSPALAAAMDGPGQAGFCQAAYDALKTNTLLIGGPYYDQSWTVLGLLMASGNYLDYAPKPTPTPTVDACQTRIKVNAGGAAQAGYAADQAYSAGSWGYVPAFAGGVGTSAGPVTGDPDPGLYLDERYDSSGTGEVRYSFSLPNGPATVTLSWAETYFSSAGQRKMNVFIGATQVETNLDIYTAAGGKNKALIKSYGATVSGGVLTIRFVTVAANATIHAIEVASGSPCTPTPSHTPSPNWTATPSPTRSPSFTASPTGSPSFTISPTFTALPTPDACTVLRRINAGGTAFTDSQGLVWVADQPYSAGSYGYVSFAAGTYGTSAGPIAGTVDDALYTGERYGNPVRYRFDVPNGAYRVRALLAETYFSSAGQRSVSVVANGTTVVNNVDLFTAAGGMNVAWQLTFTATASGGQLYLEISSSNNNGTFMGLELIAVAGCTPTSTATRTPGAAPTASFSATATPSRSPSPSASPSVTRTITATLSATPSASLSPSASASATASPSVSVSSTATATRSATASQTPSRTPSASSTSTTSRTASSTPTVTLTATASATSSVTPSLSASPSLSPTFSGTRTITPGPSPTDSPSWTASPTSSITRSATLTSSPTGTRTATPTPTATVSGTLTASFTRTQSQSPTSNASASATVTQTWTVLASATLTRSVTPSATPSLSAVLSATFTATPSASPRATALPTSTPVAPLSATAVPPTGQPLEILQAFPVPNPNPSGLAVLAQGGPGEVEVRLYTKALQCIAQCRVTLVPGWNQVQGLDLAQRANGLYFVQIGSRQGGTRGFRTCKLSLYR